MPLTVDASFRQFQKETVDLHPDVVDAGFKTVQRFSQNLHEVFSEKSHFFPRPLSEGHMVYGSFHRGTKIRELDEINLLVCLDLEDTHYFRSHAGKYLLHTGKSSDQLKLLSDGDHLNSTAVLLRLEEILKDVQGYQLAHLHHKGKAVALYLSDLDWRFDLVPCFRIEEDFYLIPDGTGNWVPTRPISGDLPILNADKIKEGRLLPLMRLLKYWNRHNEAPTIPSYVFELLVADFADSRSNLSWWTDFNVLSFFSFLSSRIWGGIKDPSGVWSDLNPFSDEEKRAIAQTVELARDKARKAIDWETEDKNHKLAISQWREIFGKGYPQYG